MNTKIYIVAIIQLLLLSVACKKEIELKLPELSPKLVVNCILNPDSIINLRLSQSKAINDTSNYLINDADIEIFENGNLLGKLFAIGNGEYKLNYKPKAGSKYFLKVSHKDFQTAKAEIYLPTLTELTIDNYTSDYIITIDDGILSTIYFTIKDSLETANFYEILFFYDEEMNSLFDRYYSYSHIDDPVLLADGDLEYQPASLFFSDQLFDGQEYRMTIKLEGQNYYRPYDIMGDDFSDSIIINNIYLQFRSISEEFYLYRKSWTKHVYNQNTDEHFEDPLTLLFLGEPLPMYTNIENGYGIFAGYSSTIKEVELIPNK